MTAADAGASITGKSIVATAPAQTHSDSTPIRDEHPMGNPNPGRRECPSSSAVVSMAIGFSPPAATVGVHKGSAAVSPHFRLLGQEHKTPARLRFGRPDRGKVEVAAQRCSAARGDRQVQPPRRRAAQRSPASPGKRSAERPQNRSVEARPKRAPCGPASALPKRLAEQHSWRSRRGQRSPLLRSACLARDDSGTTFAGAKEQHMGALSVRTTPVLPRGSSTVDQRGLTAP